ncbi:hypothetical protein A2853_04250 [Candidatus Kaiserbacteria bacterium RIFCSPHIGHO2_01_FULL_55_17]|uniref:Haloacid dehalogenase n=1 Tax=Candidatus Kaiserbacteria bacterium RIFCSPHIGHO2_01_FULL_55_17 TaxID=1798484 RepID=A0A1F6D7U8_9BACT|nr:MAG: hypothetical protein A2853_04250 [Candidatus Kaiserbacteria bacterium RIFCSPHIGHO2_01_FULL_55_17]
MEKIEVVVCFDLWNTLVATATELRNGYAGVLTGLGAPSHEIYPFVRDTLMASSLGYEQLALALLERFRIGASREAARLIAELWSLENSSARWLKNAERALHKSRTPGTSLVLVTNTTAPAWSQVDAKLGVASHFDRLFLSFNRHVAKPSPTVWQEVEGWYQDVPPERFWMVGDREEDDLRVPKSRGWNTVHIQSERDLKSVHLAVHLPLLAWWC